MKKTNSRDFIYNLANGVVCMCSVLMSLFIVVTSYIYHIDIRDMAWCEDNVLIMLVAVGLIYVFMYFAAKIILSTNNPQKSNHILFTVVFIIIAIATAWWIVNAQSLAQNDPKILHDIAVRIIQDNDYTMFSNKDSYMAICPHQSGILLYFELILRIIPNYNVVPMECLNYIYLLIGIIISYFLVREWFPNEQIVTCYTLLLLFCWPWFFYVNFAYGEVPSITLTIIFTWSMTKYLADYKKKYLVMGIVSILLSVTIRKNNLIFVIAVVLVLVVKYLKDRERRVLFVVVSVLIAAFLANIIPQKLYEFRAGNIMGKGIPAYSYIAMGLQETEGISPGWNNGYHTKVFIENGYDYEVAKEESRTMIKESITYMVNNPEYMCDFFYRKLVPEWCDQNFSALYSTSMIYYNRTDEAWKIYNGAWTKSIMQIMNVYQSVLYTGFFLFCVAQIVYWRGKRTDKRIKIEIWNLVWVVNIIGGFFFCALWEGGSRYTLPYMICMLPYAAAGIVNIFPSKSITQE